MKTVSALAGEVRSREEPPTPAEAHDPEAHDPEAHDPEAHDHCGAPPPDLPPRDVLDTSGDLLRALAAPVRIAIVLQLRESAHCVHELVEALAVPQPLVSQHLRVLKSAGVVAGERSGREVLYRLVDHHLTDIVVAAVTHAAEGRE
jgi:ArsR family transcriptional regulator